MNLHYCENPKFRILFVHVKADLDPREHDFNFQRIFFFLNNQPDALIIQIYSVIKLYMFWATSLPIIRSSLLYILCIGTFHAGF
jgi:hypothetical protein